MADIDTVDNEWVYDLTLDEARRRTAVLVAIGEHWDPAATLEAQDRAHRMLYSGLDAHQQLIYDELVRAGVLPTGWGQRAAD